MSESFLILPSVYSYLSVSLDTVSEKIDDNTVMIRRTSENFFDSGVQIGLKSSCVFEYRGKIKELCVKFKPLGIYNFFDERILFDSINNTAPFIPDDNYKKTLIEILNYPSNSDIFAGIEEFLLQRSESFSHPYLNNVIDELERADSEKPFGIGELSEKFNVSRQTLNSQFKKYLNLSPSEFRQICRFRKFIQAKLIDENPTCLTEFVYKFGFFDQSHLIKEFRKYTFLKPNDFFRKLDYSKDQNILVIWQ